MDRMGAVVTLHERLTLAMRNGLVGYRRKGICVTPGGDKIGDLSKLLMPSGILIIFYM